MCITLSTVVRGKFYGVTRHISKTELRYTHNRKAVLADIEKRLKLQLSKFILEKVSPSITSSSSLR